MIPLRVFPIVEGDGEVAAVPILLQRIGTELCDGAWIDVERPMRQPRERIARNIEGTLNRSLDLAALKMAQKRLKSPAVRELVLVMFDSDDDPACRLGPEVLAVCRSVRSDLDSVVVLAVVEFETWFVAAAPSLIDVFVDGAGNSAPSDPEAARCGKAWVKAHASGKRYSETADQPRMASQMDIGLCRLRSASFDKLCREIEKRIVTP